MAVQVCTRKFEAAHFRKPKGAGTWFFTTTVREQRANGSVDVEKTFKVENAENFRNACASARKVVRDSFKTQDAVVEVCP